MKMVELIEIMQENGYQIFTRPLELNIVGIRRDINNPLAFNDVLHVFFRSYSMERYAYHDDEMKWSYYRFPICTDPASYAYYQQDNRLWEGLLEGGQYINGFKRAHKISGKKSDVLLQSSRLPIRFFFEPINNIINSNELRNEKLYHKLPQGVRENIYHNICFEPALVHEGKKWINQHGSGCQVFEHNVDFDLFMRLCSNHQYVYGNNFSYTLLDLKNPRTSANARLGLLFQPDRPAQSQPDHQALH